VQLRDGLRQPLEVASQRAEARQQDEAEFDGLGLGQKHEAALGIRRLHHLEGDPLFRPRRSSCLRLLIPVIKRRPVELVAPQDIGHRGLGGSGLLDDFQASHPRRGAVPSDWPVLFPPLLSSPMFRSRSLAGTRGNCQSITILESSIPAETPQDVPTNCVMHRVFSSAYRNWA